MSTDAAFIAETFNGWAKRRLERLGDEFVATFPIVRELPERTQRIMVARFVERRTLEQVGVELDITRERVRQIEHQALHRLAATYDANVAAARFPLARVSP